MVGKWLGLVAGLAAGFALALPVGAADDTDGTWVGTMRQIYADDEITYPVRLTLSGDHGDSDYPSLPCGGRLERVATEKGHAVYSETIVRGRADDGTGDCIHGFVVVKREGSSLVLEWAGTYSGVPYVATGILTRDPAD